MYISHLDLNKKSIAHIEQSEGVSQPDPRQKDIQ